MQYDTLTPAQQAVVDTDASRVLFFGGRQIGKTTSAAFDARSAVRDGDDVCLSAPSHRQSMLALERTHELIRDSTLERVARQTKTTIEWVNGARVSCKASAYLDPRPMESARPRGTTHKLGQFDHIILEEIDHMSVERLDAICQWLRKNAPETTVLATGTPIMDSPNIARFAKGNAWFSVHDTPWHTPHVEDKRVSDLAANFTPAKTVTELDGNLVETASDHADLKTEYGGDLVTTDRPRVTPDQ